jgi:uncharacterized protein (TIGR04551 family)
LCTRINRASADDAADELPLHSMGLTPSPWKDFRLTLDGYYRVRGDVFNDFDLSRGPTPTTGLPVFPVAAAGGGDHTLSALDMRLRLEPTLEVGQAVRIHLRVDVLDDLGWGSTPDVLPSFNAETGAALSQLPPATGVNALRDSIRVKQAWGEVTLPFGTLAAGRMGGLISWGTGFFINNGDCIGCDNGDTGDRVALTVPVLNHYVTALYELSASGPYIQTPTGQPIDLDRRAQVHTVALSVARLDSGEAQRRKLRSGRTLLQYGVLASYRGQQLDAPAWTQPGGLVRSYGPGDFVRRDLQSFGADLWVLVHHHGFRAELEAATVIGQIGDATNMPGVSFRAPVTSTQFGGVTSLSYQFHWPVRLRFEVGFASGTEGAYGFGIPNGQLTAQKGDLFGPQISPPGQMSIDNFRFSPDYHVDLILWRRIIGQVTGGVYIKPTVRLGPFGTAFHHFTLDTSLVESQSVYVTTPPGQDRQLGVEMDLMARYRYEAGFEVDLGYGLLFPGAGFRNLTLMLDPQPAQTLELILAYRI